MSTRSAFGEGVRRELTERPPRKRCCCGALLCGIFRHAGTLEISGDGVAVRAELGDASAARLAFRPKRGISLSVRARMSSTNVSSTRFSSLS